PWTESKRSRWALVSTGPRSLMATTSMSLRPLSMMARRTLRPMRPKPLMATRTVMVSLPRSVAVRHGPFGETEAKRARSGVVPGEDALDDGLGRDAEMLVQLLVGGTGAEARHTDEDAVGADHRIPA